MKKLIPILGFALITFIYFWQVFFKGLMPIPSDTIVGLYHPYRDLYVNEYPNGVPFKNFLITDPVRQQFPWKNLTISSYKNLELPTWNPYSFSGTPNLANFQSAAFYPINLIFLLITFEYSWVILIMIQPFLAGVFLYYYLRNLKIDEYSSFFGGIIFAFSGFFATWLEWGTILHVALWLPLILLSIDKLTAFINNKKVNRKLTIVWLLIFVFSILSSFFAGHLQTFFYLSIFVLIYIILRIYKSEKKIKLASVFLGSLSVVTIISLPQSLPSLKFILLSGRATEIQWQSEGWFLPYQHLIQFLIPDFFGNPSTLNYWGVWNYGELTGFVGLVAIIFSLIAVLFRRDKKTLLLVIAILISFIIALPSPISKIPFIFNFPFISTSQPTRILFIINFSLSILAALGLNFYINKGRLRHILVPISFVGITILILFSIIQFGKFELDPINLAVAKRNFIFPLIIFFITSFILITRYILPKKFNRLMILTLIILVLFELFRFSWKFNTFSKKEFLYPESASIKFIKENIGEHRIATNDSRILASNFSIMHDLKSVEGYDPLYINRYAEFVAAINRNEPNIKPPLGFNRIIRVENFNSNLVDLLGIKYVLSLNKMNNEGFKEVYKEGSTYVYENLQVYPRVFFVKNLIDAKNKNNVINTMFYEDFDPKSSAVVEENLNQNFSVGKAEIVNYKNNKVIIKTENSGIGFLVFTDTIYPSWRVKINGKEEKIYITDFIFRGVVVPAGKNEIIFENKLL